MANVLCLDDQTRVLHHLVEGNTLRSTARLTGIHRTTIMKMMVRFGQKCREFLDRELRDLTLDHIEVDEVWTFVGKKQSRLTTIEKEEASHIGERHNLTIRTFMKRFTRLSLGFSKKLDNLAACTAIFMAYYNFCWQTRYPDWSGKRGQLRPTAAMMAGITNDVWTFEQLYAEVMR